MPDSCPSRARVPFYRRRVTAAFHWRCQSRCSWLVPKTPAAFQLPVTLLKLPPELLSGNQTCFGKITGISLKNHQIQLPKRSSLISFQGKTYTFDLGVLQKRTCLEIVDSKGSEREREGDMQVYTQTHTHTHIYI